MKKTKDNTNPMIIQEYAIENIVVKGDHFVSTLMR